MIINVVLSWFLEPQDCQNENKTLLNFEEQSSFQNLALSWAEVSALKIGKGCKVCVEFELKCKICAQGDECGEKNFLGGEFFFTS